ncbi:MAG: hypothetical protein A2Y89_07390 [Chloroflexi bacterium RBG_13_51_18]|nr:MAG: hypothetical protein A2Y89_07390 [Chloroflexi bacterium RBG_13_51_18]
MFTVRADVQKNRLYVKLVGFFDYNEMKEATDKTIEGIKKLKPGYDIINDISEFKPVGQDTLKEVERGQKYFKQSEIRHGIRVEGKAKLTNLQFNRVGKTIDYVPDAVETMEEAEKLLDSLNQQ